MVVVDEGGGVRGQNQAVYVTVFRKTNWLARKSIIAYARKYSFKHEDANGNKEKEKCFTQRSKTKRRIGFKFGTAASLLDVKGNQAIKKKKKFAFLANRLIFIVILRFISYGVVVFGGFKMCIGHSSRVYSLRTELEPLQGGLDSNLGKGISLHPHVFYL